MYSVTMRTNKSVARKKFSQLNRLKMIFVGNDGVGKSSLITRICDDVFDENLPSNLGVSFKSYTIKLNDKTDDQGENDEYLVTFWDMGEFTMFKSYCKSFPLDNHVAAFTFDITDKKSFDDIRDSLNRLKEHDIGNPKYLIGTKMDKVIANEQEQMISIDEINILKIEGKFDAIILTSAKNGSNVRKSIETVLKDAINFFKKKEEHSQVQEIVR